MVSRLSGGAAPEAFRIDIKNQSGTLIARFDETNRTSSVEGWTDINLNEYEFSWDKKGALELTMEITDPLRLLYDFVKKGFKVSLWLDNAARDVALSMDMESLLSSTSLLDISDTGNNGTITGTADVLGWHGRARDFNGTSDSISIANHATLNPTAEITLAAWVHPDTILARQFVFNKIGAGPSFPGYTLHQIASGLMRCEILNTANDAIDTVSTIPTATWTRVISTWKVGIQKIYVNGALETTRTPVNTSIGTNTNNLFIGQNGAGGEFWDGRQDELLILTRAWSDEEVAADYKRFGVAPRKYIEGRITARQNDGGITKFTVASNNLNLLEHEASDIIFEGMESADSVVPAFAHNKLLTFSSADGTHNKQHIKLLTNAGLTISSSGAIYQPMEIEFPIEGEWNATGASASIDNQIITPITANQTGAACKFTAHDKTISSIYLLLDYKGSPSSDLHYHVRILDSQMQTISSSLTFLGDGVSGHRWIKHDPGSFSAGGLTIGSDYWLSVTREDLTDPDTAQNLLWKVNQNSVRDIRQLINGVSQEEITAGSPCFFIASKNGYEKIEETNYEIKKSSSTSVMVADIELVGGTFTLIPQISGLPSTIPDFFRCSYFYSEGIKKVSDVITRLLKPVGFTSIYTGAGGLSSTLTTYALGFYAPVGGSIGEHINQIAGLTGERYEFVPPKRLRFSAFPDPSAPINGSFETLDKDNNLLGWTLTSLASQAAVAPYSGNKHVRINIPDGISNITQRLHQDIESFDQRATYTNGIHNAEIWVYKNSASSIGDTFITFRVMLYEYGTFSNEKALISIDPVTGLSNQTWTHFAFKIDRPSFRISIELKRTDFGGGGAAADIFMDDLKFHGDNFYSICIKDPAQKDSNYTTGFIPNTRRASLSENVIFIEDVDSPPNFEDQIDKSMVNMAMITGKLKPDDRFGLQTGPIIGLAKNPASISQYDERFTVDANSSAKTIKDAYQKAKMKLRFQASRRASIRLVGQYAWLSAKLPLMFFPDQGIGTPELFEITSLTLGPSFTELEVNKTIIEQVVDNKKELEEQKILNSAFSPEDIDAMSFVTHADVPTGTNIGAIYQARLVNEIGTQSAAKVLEVLDTRDAGVNSVWLFSVGKNDDFTFNTTTVNVWTQIRLQDASSTNIVTITLPLEFAKLPSEWIYIFIFAP